MAESMQTHHSIDVQLGTSGAAGLSTRDRIVAAAAELLKADPNEFSVQRAARQAGFSARLVYGHFSGGAELALQARLLTLQELAQGLPIEIHSGRAPIEAIRTFALHLSAVMEALGPAWLLSSRQDASFRRQYRLTVRGPLVALLEQYLLSLELDHQVRRRSCGALAELFVTAIESLTVNQEPDLALEVQLEDSIEWTVHSFCILNGLCRPVPMCGARPMPDAFVGANASGG